MLGALESGAPEVRGARLSLIFEDLKGPDYPEGEHRGETATEKLAHLIVEDIRMASKGVKDEEVGGHEAEGADVQYSETGVAVSKFPGLPRLTLHLGVFKRTFNDGTGGG